MFKRIGIIALSVLALAGAVALGVHLTRKDAQADQTYTVTVYVWNDDHWELWPGQQVRFLFQPEGQFWETTNDLGIVSHTLELPTQNSWSVKVQVPNEWYHNCQPWDPNSWDSNPKLFGATVTDVTFWIASENGAR